MEILSILLWVAVGAVFSRAYSIHLDTKRLNKETEELKKILEQKIEG